MVSKSSTSLSIFISDLRGLTKDKVQSRVLIERRRLHKEEGLSYSKVLTLIYFVIQGFEVDPLIFVNACASPDINIKKAGYLGLTLCSSTNLLILTVNTVMNDLKSPLSRDAALIFLCNINIKEKIYKDLTDFICISSTHSNITSTHSNITSTHNNITSTHSNINKNIVNKCKAVVAKSRLSDTNLTLVGSDDSTVYVKLQILLDTSDDATISDNDVFFIVSFYSTVKCPYFKVKLVQMYKRLLEIKRINLTESFLVDLQDDIINPSESSPLILLALSVEISELFIKFYSLTAKAEAFLRRLVDLKNPNMRFIGFRLANKYSIFPDKLIDRAIKIGINVKYASDTLLRHINKDNYKEIYRRKEEIRFVLDRNLVDYEKSKMMVYKIILKTLEYGDEDYISKVYLLNPEIVFYNTLINNTLNNNTLIKNDKLINTKLINNLINLSETTKLDMFTKLVSNPTISSLYLLYTLFPKKNMDKELLQEIFVSHLNMIITKKYPLKDLVLDKLIFTYCKYKNLDFYRDTLAEKYSELVGLSINKDILPILLNGICLMNSKSTEKLLHLTGGTFIKYQIVDGLLKIEKNPQIKILNVEMNTDKISEEGMHFSEEIEIGDSSRICIKVLFKGETYIRNIYN